MTAEATAFVTYLWHYVLARAFYDDLLRPLVRGHASAVLVVAAVVVAAFAIGRRTRRRS
jgi:hypothetical protein